MTPGHVQLAQAVQARGGFGAVERLLEVGEGTIRTLLKHERVPRERMRKLCAERLGIAEEVWQGPAVSSGSAPTLPLLPSREEVEKGEAIVTNAHDPRENALATLRRLRALLASARDPREVARLSAQITSASRLLARLSGQLEVTEAQVLRSAAWAKLVKVVRGVLEAFPGAAAALEKAMAEYEG